MSGRLVEELKLRDPEARQLVEGEVSQWVRTAFGIIGSVELTEAARGVELDRRLTELTNRAYSELERLPASELSFDELWVLVLLICVPWTRDEAHEDDEVAASLARWMRNTKGSRKRIVWRGDAPGGYFGPLGQGSSWMPASGDPLRESVDAVARDSAERNALQLLFRRRIDDSDVDELIRILARRESM